LKGLDFVTAAAEAVSPGARPIELLVAGDAVPDLVLGDIAGEIAFGQGSNMVERGVLTVGGSSAIMACGAARLGLRVAFVGVFADDAAGRFMLEELKGRGIDVSACVVLPRRTTAVCVHLVRPGAERDRAMISWRGCDQDLTAAMVRRALGGSVRHVHVGSFYLLPKLAPSLARLFSDARAAGCTTSLDPQGDPEGRWQMGLREVLRETDVFLPNQNEALAVAASAGAAPSGVVNERVLETLAALGPLPVVKCGAEGALSHRGKSVVRAGAIRTVPIDTIGAGDSFDAGFVYGHMQGWQLDSTLAFAVACGSLSTRAAGGIKAQASVTEALATSTDTKVVSQSV
jgi:sugar/nucleoside kinase (ribokinase family)